MLDPRLAQVFAFDENDLHFNRQGMLSSKQQAAYENMNRGCLRVSLIVTLVLLVGMVAAIVAYGKYGSDLLGPLITISVLTMVSGLGIWVAWKTRHDAYVIGQIEGQGRLRIDHGENGAYCVLNINGYEFVVDEDAYEVLEDGASYRVYFAVPEGQTENLKSVGKEIKSIERLA